MSRLGKITLAFGATGQVGEEPLSFEARPINLIVGPNNSGKSLFLRELSGVNPRRERRRFQRPSRTVTPPKIISSVEWSPETVAETRQEIVRLVLEGDEEEDHESEWSKGIAVRPWDELLAALEAAAKELEIQRTRVLTAIWNELEFLPAELREFSELQRATDTDDDSIATAVLGLGMVGFVMLKHAAREHEASDPDSAGADTAVPEAEVVLLPPTLARLEHSLGSYWSACLEIMSRLGIADPGVSFEEISDARTFMGLVRVKINKEVPVFGGRIADWLGRELGVPAADPVNIDGFERALELIETIVEPARLRNLCSRLQQIERDCGWSNPEIRAEFSKEVLYLDGLARLTMTSPGQLSPYGDQEEDGPPILNLLKSEQDRKLLRKAVAEVLGAQLVIDMVSQAPKVLWKLLPQAPPDGLEARYEQQTADFVGPAIDIAERSDGIHALVGMFAAMFAKGADVVFIDEPEAFLHPPLVRKFARQLVDIAKTHNLQFFIATHSPDLLGGFAPSARDINILRLSYDDSGPTPVATARLLHQNALRRLALDPLLRSESALSALFCDGAVVCEAPADRTLYQEINERLVLYGDPKEGVESCAFLNAQNWQTVGRIMRPLREMGVAAAAILDADVLFDADLTKVLEAAQVPKAIRKSLLQMRAEFRANVRTRLAQARSLDDEARDKLNLKHDVIAELTRDEREIFEHLINVFAQFGLFVVPHGELECWLTPMGLVPNTDNKRKWFEEALQTLGWDPDDPDYRKPQDDDIWQFMRQIAAWIADPQRKGTSPAD
ncbi:MAG TPA: AAA family ATPase [Enhygromyxa sp.]|nr:AAA family ATPase [Enhygromyxa sp.]